MRQIYLFHAYLFMGLMTRVYISTIISATWGAAYLRSTSALPLRPICSSWAAVLPIMVSIAWAMAAVLMSTHRPHACVTSSS